MKRKFALISLLALLLTGCSSDKTAPVSSSSQNYISQKGDSSKNPTSSKPDSSRPSSTKDSSGSIYDNTAWPRTIVDSMVEHLGGEKGVLPYLEIGVNRNTTCFWDKSDDDKDYHLEIWGRDFDDATLEDAKAVFDNTDGWVTSISNGVLTATNHSLGLKVTLENNDGTPVLKAYYDEPFAPDQATDWKDSTKAVFNTNVGGHILPYFYTGTVDEMVSTPARSSFTITGGDYDSRVLGLALNALNQDNGNNISWTIIKNDGTTLEATKTYEDGWVVHVIVKADNDNVYSSGKTVVIVSYSEPFALPAEKDQVWPSDIQTAMQDAFGVILPYIYLGATKGLTSSYDDSYHELIVNSNARWNSKIIDLAKTSFEKVHWTTSETADTSLNISLTAKGSIGLMDFEIVVHSDYTGYGIMEIYGTANYDPNHTSTDWKPGTKQALHDRVGDYPLPYVYLGTEKETFSYLDRTKQLTITGGNWDDRIYNDLLSALTNDQGWGSLWVIAEQDLSKKTITASKASSDSRKTLTLEFGYQTSLHSNHVYIRLTFFEIPASATWSQDALDAFTSTLQGFAMPFVYLGDSTTVTAEENTVTIFGDRSLDSVYFDAAKSSLEADGFTVTISMELDKEILTAEKETPQGRIKVQLSNEVQVIDEKTGNFVIHGRLLITRADSFHAPTGDDAKWDDAMEAKIESKLGEDHPVPYVYLGTSTPTIDADDYEDHFTIDGEDFDDRVLDYAKEAFTKAGATHIQKTDDKVQAMITYPDQSMIYVSVSNENGKAQMLVYKYDALTLDNSKSYGSKTKMSAAIADWFNHYSLPYMDLGEEYGSSTVSKSVSFETYNPYYIENAKTILENDGFTVTSDYYYYGPRITAKKIQDGFEYTLVIGYTYSRLSVSFDVSEVFSVPTGEDAKWNDEVTTNLSTLFSDDTTNEIPYFYTGTRNLTKSFSNETEVDFRGGKWNSQILTLAEAAFDQDNQARSADIKADGSKAWEVTYSTSGYNVGNPEGKLVATRKSNNGKKTIEVDIYRPARGSDSNLCKIEVYYK